jgi:hypothetical protein
MQISQFLYPLKELIQYDDEDILADIVLAQSIYESYLNETVKGSA